MYLVADYSVQKTPTLDRFVSAKPVNQVSYHYLSMCNEDAEHNIKYCTYNVINDYLDEIKSAAVEVELNDEEYRKFRFKPKLLANQLYGNGELYFILLYINDIWSVKDFDLKRFKLIRRSDLSKILSDINAAEKPRLDLYNQASHTF